MADKWDSYREFVRLGNYGAALAEAMRVCPAESPDPWCPRDFYVRHMVDNHLPVDKRVR